ncbi:MAG: adenylate kinase family protein [Thermoplasmata archaeon]|nr:MAG: adenylate kinase family protein [Thermoplasmata archaeon]
MKIALSGTPGVGKSTTAELLRDMGYSVIDVNLLAGQQGFIVDHDDVRDTDDVDLEAMDEYMMKQPQEEEVIYEGHLAHLLSVDMVVILRCNPLVLQQRLNKKGWPDSKVKENVQAEILDVIKVEAYERHERIYEIDTTSCSPAEVAEEFEKIMDGNHTEPDIAWLSDFNYLLLE